MRWGRRRIEYDPPPRGACEMITLIVLDSLGLLAAIIGAITLDKNPAARGWAIAAGFWTLNCLFKDIMQ